MPVDRRVSPVQHGPRPLSETQKYPLKPSPRLFSAASTVLNHDWSVAILAEIALELPCSFMTSGYLTPMLA